MAVSEQKDRSKDGTVAETVKVIIHALILALIVRTFLYQPFNIPSGSMKSTLLVGDYLFVSKFSYGYTHYSFPFSLPLFQGRIWGAEPERGDVVVFKLPRDNKTDYIKRLIGLPGDKIQVRDGIVILNGKPLPRNRVDDFVSRDANGSLNRVARYRETLPNGVSYTVLDLVPDGFSDNTPVYEVPEGHYFMMGDNRDNSTDSRVLSQVGYVPYENLIGRAEFRFFSIDEEASFWQFWKWPWAIRWSRMFGLVR
jgi:signal peptidase I